MVRRTFSLFGCSNPMWRGSSHHLPSMKRLDVYRKVNTSPSFCGGQSGPEHSMYWVDIPHWLAAIIVSLPGVISAAAKPVFPSIGDASYNCNRAAFRSSGRPMTIPCPAPLRPPQEIRSTR
jgi:hypothetical protein